MKKVIRYCIVCEQSLSGNNTGKMRTDFSEQPEKAILFVSQGSEGSNIPCETECRFEVCICDACLQAKRSLIHKYVQEDDQVIACGKW